MVNDNDVRRRQPFFTWQRVLFFYAWFRLTLHFGFWDGSMLALGVMALYVLCIRAMKTWNALDRFLAGQQK